MQLVPPDPVGSSPDDVFASSTPGILFSVVPGLGNGWNIGDLFGAKLSTIEPGNVIFPDNRPAGTVNTVTLHLPSPVMVTHFSMWVDEDSMLRSLREVRISVGTTVIDDLILLDSSGTQTYMDKYGGTSLQFNEAVTTPMSSADYKLEFITNIVNSGPRVTEFDAFAGTF